MAYTEEEAEKMIKRCTDTNCALTKHDHEIFYAYEKEKLMGKGIYYLFPSNNLSKWLNRNNKDDDKWKVTFDEYGNKTIHLGVPK